MSKKVSNAPIASLRSRKRTRPRTPVGQPLAAPRHGRQSRRFKARTLAAGRSEHGSCERPRSSRLSVSKGTERTNEANLARSSPASRRRAIEPSYASICLSARLFYTELAGRLKSPASRSPGRCQMAAMVFNTASRQIMMGRSASSPRPILGAHLNNGFGRHHRHSDREKPKRRRTMGAFDYDTPAELYSGSSTRFRQKPLNIDVSSVWRRLSATSWKTFRPMRCWDVRSRSPRKPISARPFTAIRQP